MKRIYIYYGTGGEYSTGATSELALSATGKVYAFMTSPRIDEIWREFQNIKKVRNPSINSARTLLDNLMLMPKVRLDIPFTCYCRINDRQWSCAERCNIGNETALEAMRG